MNPIRQPEIRGRAKLRKASRAEHLIFEILDPDIVAAKIVEDLQAALAQFTEIANDSKRQPIYLQM